MSACFAMHRLNTSSAKALLVMFCAPRICPPSYSYGKRASRMRTSSYKSDQASRREHSLGLRQSIEGSTPLKKSSGIMEQSEGGDAAVAVVGARPTAAGDNSALCASASISTCCRRISTIILLCFACANIMIAAVLPVIVVTPFSRRCGSFNSGYSNSSAGSATPSTCSLV